MLDTQQLQQKTSEELIQVIVELDAKNQQLQEKLTLLLSRQYKRKSEDVNQFDEPTISLDETKAVEEAEEAIRIPAHQRTGKKTGRKPIPTNLPRQQIIHDITDKETSRRSDQPSFMWGFSGGTPDKFSTVFQYAPTRDHTVPLNFFGVDYRGYLHCDGYSAYETMADKNKAILVGCMIHARRKFMDIAKANVGKNPGLAHEAINLFKQLAKIEHYIKEENLDDEQTKAYRQAFSKPILAQFKAWLDQKITLVPPKFPIHQAIQYTLNQWSKLIKYLEDGRLDWTNNLSERMMKAFATGRKNWLFSNSAQGAHASSVIYSLVATCNHHQVNVFEYFRYVLKRIPRCQTVDDFEQLLPYNVVLDNPDSS